MFAAKLRHTEQGVKLRLPNSPTCFYGFRTVSPTNVRAGKEMEFSSHREFQSDSSFQTWTESQKSWEKYKCEDLDILYQNRMIQHVILLQHF